MEGAGGPINSIVALERLVLMIIVCNDSALLCCYTCHLGGGSIKSGD